MKNTPRDFFLHVGTFLSLYLSTIALLTLLFRMVDYLFPDPLQNMYADPYSGPMRFAIASLIILLPMFLFLMRRLQKEARHEPARYTFAIRRWLTYITLFIAGTTIVGDLIVLLNAFLGGTLAKPLLCKVVVLLVIMGTIFWYFMRDVREYWRRREHSSQMVGLGALALVALVVAGGFFIMGSPTTQRNIRLDLQQIQDLTMIQQQLVNYWQQNGHLPGTLTELESPLMGFSVPPAPAGRTEYEYRLDDPRSFLLCATFAVSSEEYNATNGSPVSGVFGRNISVPELPMSGLLGNSTWDHDIGRTCFKRRIDSNLIQKDKQTGGVQSFPEATKADEYHVQ